MNGAAPRPHDGRLVAATIDDTPSFIHGVHDPCQNVALVHGSGSGITAETHRLLSGRLRAAALVLFTGFFVFLVRRFFYTEWFGDKQLLLDAFHVGVVAVLGLSAAMMCVRCPITLRRLRWAELIVFGVPGLYFLALQYEAVKVCIEQQNGEGLAFNVLSSAMFWLCLVFTYAMFIPSTWRRSAVIVGGMVAAPFALSLAQYWSEPFVAEVLGTYGISSLGLTLLCVFVIAVVGTATINRLRREAFEARRLGQYHLKKRLGAGGMGEVFLAEHQMLKRPCAVKVICPIKAGDPRVLARFEREVQATARLSHWNTVEIFDYGRTDDGTFYYAMEYLPGLTLAQLVERHGPLPPERVLHLMRQTCGALREAHDAGLLHRDIKPGNIFAAHRGGVYDVAKLLDFGLVKPLGADGSPEITQEGSIAGSPLYMSPEQVLGEEEPDVRSDIYSLGGVMYYLLAGRPPFEGDKPIRVMFAHANDAVVPLGQVRPEVPADLEEIVMRCLAKRPEDRFQDVQSLLEALTACESAGKWTDQDAANWWRSSHVPSEPEPVLA